MRRPTTILRTGGSALRWGALGLFVAGTLACGPTVYVPGPPPSEAPLVPRPVTSASSSAAAPSAPSALGGAKFVKTQSSDEWVAKTFQVQKRYARVLVVGAPAPTTVRAALLDLNAREPAEEGEEYPVYKAFATLQDAANEAKGGDLIAILPGTYVGFVLGDKPSASDEHFIHFKAMGKPGEVIINQGSLEDPNWMIYLQAAHHVILQGLSLAGINDPAASGSGRVARAGIMLDGSFGRTGKLTHHIAILGVFSHHHRKWGLHSTDSHTVLVQDSLFAHSTEEHGAYISDGSDNYVIRRNVFFANRAAGLQANLDPEASLDETATHRALRSYPHKELTRAWAEGLVKRATAQFGEHRFPDGRGVSFIIEENVMNGNGSGGGAALNLAALSDSLIQNNLIYGNSAGGIAQWDNANPFDEPYIKQRPTTPEKVTGPETLPLWGCQNNLIRNNTVVMSSARPAIQCGNGSWGCRLRNNVAINEGGPAIQVVSTSIYKLDAGYNVVSQIDYEGMPPALKSLAVSLPETRTTTGIGRARIAAELVRATDEPWVTLEGGWWKLNPNRPDFRPRAWSKLLVGQGDPRDVPARDLLGVQRTTADLGAFAPTR